MYIDLNVPEQFTVDNVRAMIASADNSVHNQIRVDNQGIASVSQVVGNEGPDDLAFRLETFIAGSGWVGKRAAEDTLHVQKIYDALEENWPHSCGKDDYIDIW